MVEPPCCNSYNAPGFCPGFWRNPDHIHPRPVLTRSGKAQSVIPKQMTPQRQGANIAQPPWLFGAVAEALVLLVICGALWWLDVVLAYSALIGGVISVIPNAYFARQVFRYSGARASQAVAQSFYRGETAKFITTALMFAGAFALVRPIVAGAVFAMFVTMLVLHGVLSWWLISKR